jgi:hypothetical protein
MTTVINIFGGPGCGKSIAASDVYSDLSKIGYNVELVREYIKDWVWEGRKRFFLDQIYILSKQMRREQICLSQVDFIVTDSPVWLSSFYEYKYGKHSDTLFDVVKHYYDEIHSQGHRTMNFFLARQGEYVEAGRYQSASEAIALDQDLRDFLNDRNIDFFEAPDRAYITSIALRSQIYNEEPNK